MIGALLKNRDLLLESDGKITLESTAEAMRRVGISDKVILGTTTHNFFSDACPTCPVRIDPFKMNTIPDGVEQPSPVGEPHEHFRSTGIRDGSAPSVGRWREAESTCVRGEIEWNLKSNQCLSNLWDSEEQPDDDSPFKSNDVDSEKRPSTCSRTDSGPTKCPSQLHGAINFFFQELGSPSGEGATIPKDEYRALWLEGEYPSAFLERSPRRCILDAPSSTLPDEPTFGLPGFPSIPSPGASALPVPRPMPHRPDARCDQCLSEATSLQTGSSAERYCRCILAVEPDPLKRGEIDSFVTMCGAATTTGLKTCEPFCEATGSFLTGL